ncbi:hypothetical protein [Streptomyces sp. NPDC059787]|uniref:hypothetical protein n=1 Tax=Streptomyces sp. NPDC059787 TaxID=3346947 RepID=UPI00364F9D51
MAPPAGGIAGDVDVDFHHGIRPYEGDVQNVAAAPPGRERAARPRVRVVAFGRRQHLRQRGHGSSERDGPADVPQRARTVVPPEQQCEGRRRVR